jgi:hypothetical protein
LKDAKAMLGSAFGEQKYSKLITGIFHSLEYECWVAVVCLAYGVPFVWSQIVENRMMFSIRTGELCECVLL